MLLDIKALIINRKSVIFFFLMSWNCFLSIVIILIIDSSYNKLQSLTQITMKIKKILQRLRENENRDPIHLSFSERLVLVRSSLWFLADFVFILFLIAAL